MALARFLRPELVQLRDQILVVGECVDVTSGEDEDRSTLDFSIDENLILIGLDRSCSEVPDFPLLFLFPEIFFVGFCLLPLLVLTHLLSPPLPL